MWLNRCTEVCNKWLRLLAGVQVDLISLLDLQMLQDNNEEDEGLEPATLATRHDIRPEVDGQEGDKLDSELTICCFKVFFCREHKYFNFTACTVCATYFTSELDIVIEKYIFYCTMLLCHCWQNCHFRLKV